jgi:hypothetical protein
MTTLGRSERLASAAERVGPGWYFEETPALRSAVVLTAGGWGKAASEAAKWIYAWLLQAGEWPEGSEVRAFLKAAGAELRFLGEQLDGLPNQKPTRRRVREQVEWIALQLGEEVPVWTPGALRDPFLLHVTDAPARAACEEVGVRLWEWAAGQPGFAKSVLPAVAEDLRVLADYLAGTARLAEQSTLDSHLAPIAADLALETAQLAAEIER